MGKKENLKIIPANPKQFQFQLKNIGTDASCYNYDIISGDNAIDVILKAVGIMCEDFVGPARKENMHNILYSYIGCCIIKKIVDQKPDTTLQEILDVAKDYKRFDGIWVQENEKKSLDKFIKNNEKGYCSNPSQEGYNEESKKLFEGIKENGKK